MREGKKETEEKKREKEQTRVLKGFFEIISKLAAMPNPRRAIGDRANGLNTLACFSVHGGVVGVVCRLDEAGWREGLACREAPRTLSPTVQNGAISFSGENEGTHRGRLRTNIGLRWWRKGRTGGEGFRVRGRRKERVREAAIF